MNAVYRLKKINDKLLNAYACSHKNYVDPDNELDKATIAALEIEKEKLEALLNDYADAKRKGEL